MDTQLADWANHAYALAKEAGDKIMEFYTQAEAIVPEYKEDDSPLTIADRQAHQIIFNGLVDFALDAQGPAPVLSEEGKQVPFIERQRWARYWCVDPLDGTKEFLSRNDEFTVNIALIIHHQPVIGILYVPTHHCGYLAWRGGGAYRCGPNGQRERILTQRPVPSPLRVLVSRHYGPDTLQPWLPILGETRIAYQGSALKFCALASGQADLFLRLSPTSEWDNAAGQCLLEEAGGGVFSLDGLPLSYNHSGSLEQGKFIAVGDKAFNWSKCLRADLL